MPQLGKTTVGTTTGWTGSTGTLDGTGPFTAAAGGVAGSGWLRVAKPTGSQAVRLVLYADNGAGTGPGAPIKAADEVVLTTALAAGALIQFSGWTKAGGPPTIVAGTKYWIGIWYGGPTGDAFAVYGSTPGNGWVFAFSAYSSTAAVPPSIGTPTVGSYNYGFDAYFDYTTAGPATVSGAAALTASGALTSTAIRTRLGASALSALGALSATGTRKRLAATVLGGAGTLSATGRHTAVGEAQLVGGGTLTIPLASRIRIGQAFLSGDGSLSAVGRPKRFASAAVTGAGSLSASATVTTGPVIRTGAAALSGRGSLFIASPTTVLANADNLYLGATPVSVVYVGPSEAWRP